MTAPDPQSDVQPDPQQSLDFDSATAEAESFEALFTQLESIAAQLEAGSLSLEESVALYERGMAIAARCQELLGDVEQRIEVLRQRANGGNEPG
jgi:exodeoxyribonuclease VII small subunit